MSEPARARVPDISGALLDSLTEQVAVVDSSGAIVQVNEAWRDAAAAGRLAVDAPDPGASYLAALRAALARNPNVAPLLTGTEAVLAGTVDRFEHEYQTDCRGVTYWFSQRAVAFRGSPGGAVVAHLDITERKAAERQKEAHRFELERAVRAATLGQLSGALAHELNQPLTAILANAQVVTATRRGGASAELLEILTDIEVDARRASKIIQGLRTLLQKQAPEFDTLNLNRLIDDTLELASSELLLHRVDVEVAEADGLVVNGDAIELQHLLLNLVVNGCEALAATPPGERKLLISAAPLDDRRLRLIVADNGPGIGAGQPERLFEAFNTSKDGGLGLGLSICRSIVEAHGGTIKIENRPEGGAQVTVDLPAEPCGDAAPARATKVGLAHRP